MTIAWSSQTVGNKQWSPMIVDQSIHPSWPPPSGDFVAVIISFDFFPCFQLTRILIIPTYTRHYYKQVVLGHFLEKTVSWIMMFFKGKQSINSTILSDVPHLDLRPFCQYHRAKINEEFSVKCTRQTLDQRTDGLHLCVIFIAFWF